MSGFFLLLEKWRRETTERKKKEEKLTFALKKKGKHEYEQGGGIALEAQDFTDFLHHPEFPTCILEPGQALTRVFELRWGVTAAEKDGASCGAAEKKAATASSDNKSAVGAEEMMM